VNEHGHALIGDFGTSRPVNYDATLTPDTGTVHYAAPEMYKESVHFSGKVDVFSFGLILYEILTGRPVFPPHMRPFPILGKVLKGDMPEIPVRLTPIMQTIIHSCWAMNPETRPSFAEVLKEIEMANFAIVPGADPDTIREFCAAVSAWEELKPDSDA
jgi:serine/threonine protein kinase